MQRLGAQVLDLLAGLPTLRALGREHGPGARVRSLGDAHRRATMGTLRIAFLSGMVLELLTTLSVALVAVGIGLRLVDGDLDLVTGIAVLVLAPEVFLPLRQVGAQFHAAADGVAAAGQAFAVLETPVPRGRDADRPGPAHRDAAARRRRRRRHARTSLDLVLRPGTVVALTGPSGVGKTTAVEVVLGLLRPDAGRAVDRTASTWRTSTRPRSGRRSRGSPSARCSSPGRSRSSSGATRPRVRPRPRSPGSTRCSRTSRTAGRRRSDAAARASASASASASP